MSQPAASLKKPARASRQTAFVQALFFVLGFAVLVIGLFGFIGTVLGDVIFDARETVSVIGGILMILFGLFTLRIVNIPILYSDTRRMNFNSGAVGGLRSFLIGLSFAAGWTPCIGPFLGAILSLSVTSQSIFSRLALLGAYVLGLGIPFLLVALFADRLTPALSLLKRNMRVVEIVSGLLLIGVGILQLTGKMAQLTAQIAGTSTNTLETAVLGDGAGQTLSIFIAAAAGFLSFASPCVLPLIPAYISYISGVAVNAAAQDKA